jgi:dCMP deaminase
MKTFEEAWAEKERAGYQYGSDALDLVRFGWQLHDADKIQGDRPTWPETWMAVARTMSERSYDPRLRVGAIVVSADNTQMLSVGYNGNYKGGPHVHESPEPGKSGFIHAEVNALVKCDFNFAKQKHMYVTHMPCKDCAKLIINAEIVRVVWEVPYRLTDGVDLLKSVGIEVLSLEEAIMMGSK